MPNPFIPKKRLCPGRTVTYPITPYNPFLWLKGGNGQYTIFPIDGFVINDSVVNKVTAIFLKFELASSDDVSGQLGLGELLNIISENELKAFYRLSKILKCENRIFVWPKDYPKDAEEDVDKIFVGSVNESEGKLDISFGNKINIRQLQGIIHDFRGRSFPNVKSLDIATSNVECFLANFTQDPWPGDIDAIVFDNAKQVVKAIIEFKTHNQPTSIKDEYIGKYGQQDWRRFKVIFDLQNQLERMQGVKPKVLYMAWGTKDIANHAEIKIDEINASRTIIKTVYIPRPNTFDSYNETLFQAIQNIIDS